MEYAIVRPGALTDDKGTGKIKLAKKLNERGSISREDVAETLVASLHDDIATNKTFEILEGDTEIDDAVKTI